MTGTMSLRAARSTGVAVLLALVWCVTGVAQAQKPTFSVSGQGTALTRLNLILEAGSGIDRPAMLQAAKATQRALLSSGFFAIGILPPGQTSAGNWTEGQVTFPVKVAIEQASATDKRVSVEVMDGGVGRSNFRRQFQISGGTLLDIGYATADIIYEHFLDREGYFASRILYVRVARDRGRKAFQIVSSDLFGEGLQVHVSSRSELTSPQMSPDGSRLYYIGIRNARPQIFQKSFPSGRETAVFNDREIRFSLTADGGGNLYYTKSVNGNSDIYRLASGSRREERLTVSGGIETEPSVSPDGSRLAYVTDSSGRQRVVTRPLQSKSVSVAGTFKGRYSSPSWSPDGKMLALTYQSGGAFGITVKDMETGEERQVSSSFFEENPAWARNGKVILFERAGRGSGGETGLWLVDVDTNHVFRLPIAGLPRDPHWVR
jgi:tol-pal system beta propeller repeat protein TolB